MPLKTCAWCHEPMPMGVHPYTLRLELFPAVEPSLDISKEALEQDLEKEMKRLIGLMEKMDAAEVIEEEKRMFMSRSFTLCPRCRDTLARELDRLRPPDA
jgi:hypothetical protein